MQCSATSRSRVTITPDAPRDREVSTRRQFRNLGALEMRRDGVVAEVGAGQRALLALSMCSTNKVISCDRWIDGPLAGQATRSSERMLR